MATFAEEYRKVREQNNGNGSTGVQIVGLVVMLLLLAAGIHYCSGPDKPAVPEEAVYQYTDGTVLQVKHWAEKHMKDPDSIQYRSWGKLQKQPDGTYIVWSEIAAKNSFGGYVVEKFLFRFDKEGNIEGVVPLGAE